MSINVWGSNIPVDISKGGTSNTTYNSNGVLYYDGTKLASTTSGNATEVLTSQGAGAPPIFAPLALGNGLQFVTSFPVPAGNSGTEVTTGYDPNYTTYLIIYENFNSTSYTTSPILGVQLSTDNGATYIKDFSFYSPIKLSFFHGGPGWSSSSASGTTFTGCGLPLFLNDFGASASKKASGAIFIHGINKLCIPTCNGTFGIQNAGTMGYIRGQYIGSPITVNRFKIVNSAYINNLTGTIFIYRLKTS